jgi:hypothetical protein
LPRILAEDLDEEKIMPDTHVLAQRPSQGHLAVYDAIGFKASQSRRKLDIVISAGAHHLSFED